MPLMYGVERNMYLGQLCDKDEGGLHAVVGSS